MRTKYSAKHLNMGSVSICFRWAVKIKLTEPPIFIYFFILSIISEEKINETLNTCLHLHMPKHEHITSKSRACSCPRDIPVINVLIV